MRPSFFQISSRFRSRKPCVRHALGLVLGAGLLSVLSGCANLMSSANEPVTVSSNTRTTSTSATPWHQASLRQDTKGWHHRTFPGKQPSRYAFQALDGRPVMGAQSSAAASMLQQRVQIAPEQLQHVRFSWKVPALIAEANMAQRDSDDSPVRLVLAFDGDRSRLSARDHMLSELALTLTGEDMPYATLMYVWSNQLEAGTVVKNPRTDRIRKLVLESGPDRLNRWLDYERDIRADFRQAFGEEPGRLVAVGIMTDTDNTRSQAQAWYGPVTLGPATEVARSP